MSRTSCWNCQTPLDPSPLCSACGKVQPLQPGTTHFEALGVARRVQLAASELEKAYRERSLKVHPDRFAQADARERRFSVEQTTALTMAYQTLKDDARRAMYLLSLNGVDLMREDAGTQKDLPLSFLEEVLEQREALAQAREVRDLPRVQQMGMGMRNARATALDEAKHALEVLEARPRDTQALQKATLALSQVRYFDRFLEEVDAIVDAADDTIDEAHL
ncbi:MAG: Fe-S protein assembly co-chaperone HscB [Myxococcaceae bacterium]